MYRDKRKRKFGGFQPWCVSYVDLNGRRRRASTNATTRAEAEEILRAKMSAITKAKIAGVTSVESLKPMQFVDFLQDEFRAHVLATRTTSTARGYLSMFHALLLYFGKKQLGEIITGDIQRFVDRELGRETRRGKPRSAASVNRSLMLMSSVMSEAVRRGYLLKNPVTGVKQRPEHGKRWRFLTEVEVERLLTVSQEWLRPVLITALNAGLRRRESLDLLWSEVDFVGEQLTVINTKNHRNRVIPMNKTLISALKGVLPHAGKDGLSPYVFTNPATELPFRDVYHALQRATRQAGLRDVSFHTLRHTFASHLAAAGVGINTIKELLGHSDLKTTARYLHLAPNEKKEAVSRLVREEIPSFKGRDLPGAL
ncbi:MAG: site-specific integrase [Planctomycetota bacterium]